MSKKRKNKKAQFYPIPISCRYCGGFVQYVSNKELYGRVYGAERGADMCYMCTNCKASVGVHPYTNIPLGILADDNLKELKKKAHALFDPLWKSGYMSRTEAYTWLAGKLSIPLEQCHIGWFTEETLNRVIVGMERIHTKCKENR